MNDQAPAPKNSGCLIKAILIGGILAIQIALSAALSGSRGFTMNPIVAIICLAACTAVIQWKPKGNESFEVKPLQKPGKDD